MRFTHGVSSRLQRNHLHRLHTPQMGRLLGSEPQTRKCHCPKWLNIYANGKGHRKSTKFTSWKTAEELAAAERERSRTGTAVAAKDFTVNGALQQWLASFKDARWSSTARIYKTCTDKISRRVDANSIELFKGVTRTQLSQWRGNWGREPLLPDGNPRRLEDQFGRTGQSLFLRYLKRCFAWAEGGEVDPGRPRRHLKDIKPEGAKTVPLDPEQFDQVMVSVECQQNWNAVIQAQPLLPFRCIIGHDGFATVHSARVIR
jgi:hypothetical protein